jgi:hypothetical protein
MVGPKATVRICLALRAPSIGNSLAHLFGPEAAGLFLSFPAILCASATLIEKHEGERKQNSGFANTADAAALDAAGAGLGSIGLAAFGLGMRRAWLSDRWRGARWPGFSSQCCYSDCGVRCASSDKFSLLKFATEQGERIHRLHFLAKMRPPSDIVYRRVTPNFFVVSTSAMARSGTTLATLLAAS